MCWIMAGNVLINESEKREQLRMKCNESSTTSPRHKHSCNLLLSSDLDLIARACGLEMASLGEGEG